MKKGYSSVMDYNLFSFIKFLYNKMFVLIKDLLSFIVNVIM